MSLLFMFIKQNKYTLIILADFYASCIMIFFYLDLDPRFLKWIRYINQKGQLRKPVFRIRIIGKDPDPYQETLIWIWVQKTKTKS